MKRIRNILLLILALAWAGPSSFAQDATTEGKEFWVSFMSNGFKDHPNHGTWLRTQLLISAKDACSCTIMNPRTGWQQSFNIDANSTYLCDNIDEAQACMELAEYETVRDKGLIITTTDTVSVYCSNIAAYSFDVSYVMPVEGLADDYIIQTYDQSENGDTYTSAFLIVATEDNTIVQITPSTATMGGHAAGSTFEVTLNAGQTYQVRSNSTYQSDLSGSRVTASDGKKIAVFNGNNLTRVPVTARNDADCIFEQAMPVRSWGKKFVVTSSLDRSEDYVKITSAANGNEIRRNGTLIQTLNANESYTFRLSSSAKSCYLESTQRCAVYLFNSSSETGANGAPSMVWIAPIEQRIEEITFSTFNYDHEFVNIGKHYVNIIVESQDVGQVYLDDALLPADQFEAAAGNSHYSFIRKTISHGVHRLHCPNGFNAHIYGFGDSRGYAYMAGSKAADLTTSITINETAINPYDTVVDCALDDISFLADINLFDYNLVWDFGDGTTSTENPVSHHYESAGIHEASLTITTEETPCGGSSTTNTYTFYIDSHRDDDLEIYDTVCFTHPDTYTQHGIVFEYDEPGHYHQVFTVTNESGCQSRVILDLSVNAIIDLPPDHPDGACDVYEWRANTYTASDHYTDTVNNETGCYTVYHLDLDLGHTPNPAKIQCINPGAVVYGMPEAEADTIAVVTNTEFFSFQYTFRIVETNDECVWDDTCKWTISRPTWAIEYDPIPKVYDGKYYSECKVYVAEQDDNLVELTAIPKNGCGAKERKFYLKSSFLGIEGHEGTYADFSIVPNPNKGEMDLHFENLTGKVSVKVYDMRGCLIDDIETYNNSTSGNLHYVLSHKSSGIYFFVATAKEGTIAKKVIIE